jgi:hypothetical protein
MTQTGTEITDAMRDDLAAAEDRYWRTVRSAYATYQRGSLTADPDWREHGHGRAHDHDAYWRFRDAELAARNEWADTAASLGFSDPSVADIRAADIGVSSPGIDLRVG